MTALDALILLGFVAAALASGLRARARASRSLEEYFLAGRDLPGWQAGASMAATQFAADTPLLVTGLVATAGIFALWRLWIYAIAFLLLGFVMAPLWRRARVLTDAELAELRYAARFAAWLRGLKAVWFGTLFNCTVLAMVLWAAKEIAEPFLVWDRWLPEAVFAAAERAVTALGVPFARETADGAGLWLRSTNNVLSLLAIVAVTALYSATGGLRGVVRTDLLQLALMLAGTAAYAGFVLHAVGGPDGLVEGLRARFGEGAAALSADEILAFTPSRAADAGTAVLALFALQWLVQMNADGTGYLAQRTMACRSDADAKRAALVFTGLQVWLRSLLWLPIGLGLLIVFPPDAAGIVAAEREASYVRGMVELLPPGVRGLLLTAMLAALASTIDTHLNWGASYWTHDLYARFWCRWRGRTPGPRALVRVARASSLAILAIALAIATQLSSIQQAWQASLLLGAGMGVPLLLRWWWWRFTARGEIGAIAASAGLAPLLLAGVADEATRLLVMAAASTGVGVALSLALGPEPDETLRRFHDRVRPPGFWGPFAAGDDGPRRLARGLAATGLASLSCFALLVGCGSWLVGSPPPLAWPGGGAAWSAANLALGVGLVPVWWRLGFGGPGSPRRAA